MRNNGWKFWFRLFLFRFVSIGGQHHTLIVTNENKCLAIGRTNYGRLGIGDTKEEVIDKLTPIDALSKLNVILLECGECCSFAVTDDGKVYSWGMGSNQQLGLGSEDDQLIPTLLTGAQVKERQVISVSSGGQHTLFIAVDKATKWSINVHLERILLLNLYKFIISFRMHIFCNPPFFKYSDHSISWMEAQSFGISILIFLLNRDSGVRI